MSSEPPKIEIEGNLFWEISMPRLLEPLNATETKAKASIYSISENRVVIDFKLRIRGKANDAQCLRFYKKWK